jgi:hypothetical protein
MKTIGNHKKNVKVFCHSTFGTNGKLTSLRDKRLAEKDLIITLSTALYQFYKFLAIFSKLISTQSININSKQQFHRFLPLIWQHATKDI